MMPAPQELRTYFVTAVAANRRRLFQVETVASLLLDVLQSYREQKRFALHAFVFMPEHLHILFTPAPEVSLEKAVQFIKGGFSFRHKGGRDIWERSFNESQIRSWDKFEACRRYIEQNPLRAGLDASEGEYVFSSAHWPGRVDPIPEHFVRAWERPGAKAPPL
jgi:putative transposase